MGAAQSLRFLVINRWQAAISKQCTGFCKESSFTEVVLLRMTELQPLELYCFCHCTQV